MSSARLSAGLLFLLVVWVGVYWSWTPREPGITLATEPVTPDSLAPPPHEQADRATGKGSSTGSHLAAPIVSPSPAPSKTDPTQIPRENWPKVIPPEMIPYTVREGDTIESISRKFYGTTAHAKAIAGANATTDPMRLRAGRVLNIPKDPANVQGKPAPEPPPSLSAPALTPVQNPSSQPASPPPAPKSNAEYTVQSGDSLSRIAKRFYDDSTLSHLIFEANRDQLSSPDEIRVGQKLRIPPR